MVGNLAVNSTFTEKQMVNKDFDFENNGHKSTGVCVCWWAVT